MAEERQPLFVGVDTVIFDLGVSRAKAYDVIKQLNKELKKENILDKNLNNLNQRNVSVVVKLEYLNQKIIYVNQVIVNFIII